MKTQTSDYSYNRINHLILGSLLRVSCYREISTCRLYSSVSTYQNFLFIVKACTVQLTFKIYNQASNFTT